MTDLSGRAWFPQLPLALALALLGLLHLISIADQVESLHLHLLTPENLRQDLAGVTLPGISQLSIGVFLFIISVGLWLHSKLAWLLAVLALAVGTTLIPAMARRIQQITTGRHSKVIRKDHYIIVGFSALSNNTHRELVSRQKHVTVILQHESDGTQYSDHPDIDMVVGDGGDLDTLRKAGGEQAKAILALSDDDSENAFVILAVKELKSKARTVVAVSQAKHLARVRRVHPDMIIAPQVLGGELLTSMLTGERIDVKSIMGRLLGQTASTSKTDEAD